MILTQFQRHFLEYGLANSVTKQEKWLVVFSIILPNIIGCKIHQDRIAAFDHSLQQEHVPYTISVKVKQCSFTAEVLSISADEPKDYKEPDWARTITTDFELSLTREHPLLEDNKLILGTNRGFGGYKWYIPLEFS